MIRYQALKPVFKEHVVADQNAYLMRQKRPALVEPILVDLFSADPTHLPSHYLNYCQFTI